MVRLQASEGNVAVGFAGPSDTGPTLQMEITLTCLRPLLVL
jgi:hypothetical protein